MKLRVIWVLVAVVLAGCGVAVSGGRAAAAAVIVRTGPAVFSGGSGLVSHGALVGHGTVSQRNTVNWAGYVAQGQRGSMSTAVARFVVPQVTCRAGESGTEAAFWGGLDGAGSSTVEQEGVDGACQAGKPYYFAWFELYPGNVSGAPGVVVRPGDAITATTSYAAGVFTLSVFDNTNGTHDSETQALSSAVRVSAECIAEDPGTPPIGYSHYGQVTFLGCSVNGAPISSAGQPGSAFDLLWLTCATGYNSHEAVASALGVGGAFGIIQGPPVGGQVPGAVAMAGIPSGYGYWVATAGGMVVPFWNASNYGSLAGVKLAQPIVGMAASPDGAGYWLVGSDGGIFAFGDAQFYGSMGGSKLNQPIVGMVASPDGAGYDFVAADGGVFSFGDAKFWGGLGGQSLAAPIVGVAAAGSTAGGYWMVDAAGLCYGFGADVLG